MLQTIPKLIIEGPDVTSDGWDIDNLLVVPSVSTCFAGKLMSIPEPLRL